MKYPVYETNTHELLGLLNFEFRLEYKYYIISFDIADILNGSDTVWLDAIKLVDSGIAPEMPEMKFELIKGTLKIDFFAPSYLLIDLMKHNKLEKEFIVNFLASHTLIPKVNHE